MKRLLTLIALAALSACSKPAQDQAAPVPSGSASEGDAASASAVPGAAAPAAVTTPAKPVPAAPEAPSESRDPGKVVVAWAKAMTLKQWGNAYLYWGDHGERSGLTLYQFAAKWGKLANPEFELHAGDTEGGAGSLYYTAPIVLIDGKRHVRGEIVLRRVGDVDGATPEQLRWHIESLTVSP